MNKLKLASAALLILLLFTYALRRRASFSRADAVAGGSVHIRIGTNRALGTVTPYIARDKGFFQQNSVQAQIVDFNDPTVLMESLASGQLDVALVGIAPSAIWQQRGVRLKVVAAANGGGHLLLTRDDTGIRTLADLRGRKVATPKPGTVTDTLFRAHILGELAHLNAERDVQLVPNMAASDMPTVLFASREVDAAITWEPFATQAEQQYKNHVVLLDASAQWRKEHPNLPYLYPVNVVIASQMFIDSHPEELRRFLSAYVDAVRFINRQPDEANEIISQEMQLSRSTVAAARRRIDFTAHVDVNASFQTLKWSETLGYLKTLPTAEQLFDLRFLPTGVQ